MDLSRTRVVLRERDRVAAAELAREQRRERCAAEHRQERRRARHVA